MGKKKTNLAGSLNLAGTKNWRPNKTDYRTERGREGGTEGERDGETETRVKDLLASGVPPKGLEATC